MADTVKEKNKRKMVLVSVRLDREKRKLNEVQNKKIEIEADEQIRSWSWRMLQERMKRRPDNRRLELETNAKKAEQDSAFQAAILKMLQQNMSK